MIRNLKVLGLALVAAFALSAVAAAGASAQHTFTSPQREGGTEVTYLTGTTEEGTIDKFTVGSILGTQTVECHGHFEGEGTFPANAHEITMEAEYSECKFHGEPASVDMNGCAYIFKTQTDVNGDATTEVECPAPTSETTNMIEVTNSLCDMWVGAQVGEEGVHYTNISDEIREGEFHTGAGTGQFVNALTVTSTVKTHIHAKQATETCFSLASTGTYEGVATVTGYSDAARTNPVNISIDEG